MSTYVCRQNALSVEPRIITATPGGRRKNHASFADARFVTHITTPLSPVTVIYYCLLNMFSFVSIGGQLVEKAGWVFGTSQKIGWEDRLVYKMTYNVSSGT